jgi:transposase InsO family protein
MILSDQGPQFNSDLMKQFHALCGTKAIRTAPYHPQANGTVERFHGTLKTMLKKVIHKKPRQWHRYLPALVCMQRAAI